MQEKYCKIYFARDNKNQSLQMENLMYFISFFMKTKSSSILHIHINDKKWKDSNGYGISDNVCKIL